MEERGRGEVPALTCRCTGSSVIQQIFLAHFNVVFISSPHLTIFSMRKIDVSITVYKFNLFTLRFGINMVSKKSVSLGEDFGTCGISVFCAYLGYRLFS